MNEPLILEIQRLLEKMHYPSPLAVAKEIVDFSKDQEEKIDEILQSLSKGKPWEYIRGYTYFKNNKIFVNPNVLIPRIETEKLIDIVKENISKNDQIIDVGTGSGCIAISIGKIFPKNTIFATEICKKAFKVAEKNVIENNCKNIKLVNTNLIDFEFDKEKPTVIVANLPYIPSDIMNSLDDSVKNYEPKKALDGGEHGIKFYKELLEKIKAINLKYALFEIDSANVNALKNKIRDYKYKFLKDDFGKTRFLEIKP